MDYYDELKSKNDILLVAWEMGYRGQKTGSCYQGDCPRHGSEKGKCLVIRPSIQRFKCFHCGMKGDVIDLVMLFKDMSHKEARDFLADRAGLPHLDAQNLSPEEIEKRKSEAEERQLVENMFSKATDFFHDQLPHYPDILTHLLIHYKFSQNIIDELQLGFSPPPRDDNPHSELAEYLSTFPDFKDHLALSSLFTFSKPSGPYYDYFKGRIIFPYWKGGKVVYLTRRATSLTPVDQFECYLKDEKIKQDAKGNSEYIKYKKLRTHDPNDERRKHISRVIQNDVFMGEDVVRGQKEVIITEGAPDWVSAVDKGFAAISPVTTNFREQDMKKLRNLLNTAYEVYIINDNDQNQAGQKGALNTAKYLAHEGRNIYIVDLPRPSNVNKIDLNEYFLNHNADDLRKIMESSESYLETLIGNLPEKYEKAQPIITRLNALLVAIGILLRLVI